MKRVKEPCGCEAIFYEDGSAPPEIIFCRLHKAAAGMLEALKEIRDTVAARSMEHSCTGIYCSTCYPAAIWDVARNAILEA